MNTYKTYIEHFFYDDDGLLYWKKLPNEYSHKIKVGGLAGHLDKATGYYMVKFNNIRYKAHRILYQMYHRVNLLPKEQIDHINGNKSDNKKENLRIATQSQNCMNRKSTKKNLSTGIKNISILKNEWQTYYNLSIVYNGKIFRKLFRVDKFSLEYVIKIRDIKLLELHGEFMNKGGN